MNLKWFLALALAGIASAADIKAPPWETPHLVIGRDLFRENCAICHDTDDSTNTVLGTPKCAHYGIHAIGRCSEDKIGILPADPGHEQEFVC